MKKPWKIILTITFLSALIPAAFIIAVYSGVFGPIQSKEELLGYKNATASVVLSEEGELIGKIFSENRTNISFRQLPVHLVNALIATEDARFFEHEGIDSRSLLRVLIKTVIFNKRNAGGGSTISQQLAKNMFGRNNSNPLAIYISKVKEALLAHRLEKAFTKEEILTLYLNTVSFGENVFGIEAASARYFNKKVELLTIEESAVLVGILKANNFYNPRLHPENARSRRNIVLNQMKKYNYLGANEADSLCKLPLVQNYANIESEGPADYFLYQVKNKAIQILQNIQTVTGKKWNIGEDGLIITTTLNLTLQSYVNNSFHDHLTIMQKRLNEQYGSDSGKLLHAGLLAVNPVTGAVKAWVGGIDFKTFPYDQILAKRQLASTFKPILYAEALEEGIRPCYYLDNDSIVLSGFEDWSPENFDHSSGGKYSLAGALVNSMNIPTFNLYLDVGFNRLDSMWRKMGFSFPLINTPSLAIGVAEASISEVAIAYSSFANGGYKITPQEIVSIKLADGNVIWQNEFDDVKTRILTERTTQLISAILQRAVREGTGAQLGTVYGVTLPIAGKTGTSQDYADAWFAAFNPSLVLVSRVGAMSPSVHFKNATDGSGSTLALPLVAMTLKKIGMNPQLMQQLITDFPELTPELAAELDCPDFREKKMVENFIDIFRSNKIPYNKETSRRDQKKNGIFKRIFGSKNVARKAKQPPGL